MPYYLKLDLPQILICCLLWLILPMPYIFDQMQQGVLLMEGSQNLEIH